MIEPSWIPFVPKMTASADTDPTEMEQSWELVEVLVHKSSLGGTVQLLQNTRTKENAIAKRTPYASWKDMGRLSPEDPIREAKILQYLAKRPECAPFTAKVIDAYEAVSGPRHDDPADEWMLLLEHFKGGDLLSTIERQSPGTLIWPESKLQPLAVEMTRMVAALHSVHIAHLDLKPEHFVYDVADEKKRQLKLVDFGMSLYCKATPPHLGPSKSPQHEHTFSKSDAAAMPDAFIQGQQDKENKATALNEKAASRRQGGLRCVIGARGTNKYMAPEVYSSSQNRGAYDPFAADAWSLGATLYVLLFIQHPYRLARLDDEAFIRAVELGKTAEYLALICKTHNVQLSSNCIDFLCQLFEWNPDKRMTLAEARVHPFLFLAQGTKNV